MGRDGLHSNHRRRRHEQRSRCAQLVLTRDCETWYLSEVSQTIRGTPLHRTTVGWLLSWSEIEHERCCFLSLFLVCAPSIYMVARAIPLSFFPLSFSFLSSFF